MPRRFFISPEAIAADSATLTGPEAHHILHVLRLKEGAILELFDGSGKLCNAQITGVGRDKVILRIVSTSMASKPKPELHLAPALLKGKKLELVLQKAVELGVAGLHPFVSKYCDRQSAKGNTTVDRWQRIVLEACKQCGQALLPQLSAPVPFSDLMQNASRYDRMALCYEKETTRKLNDISLMPTKDKAILLITGPEGGFSDDEIALALKHHCNLISLGPLTLRAETAAIAVIAIVQHRLGVLG